MDDREYTLIEHLTDLRTRVARAAIGVVVVSLACFIVSEDIIRLLRIPLEVALDDVSGGQAKFVVIAPAEYFIAQMKAAMVGGVFLSAPWWVYQVWLFISPGLYEHEKRWATAFVIAGAFFFVAGGVFAYTLVFPGMFRFFLAATLEADVEMTLSIAEHLSFSLKLLLAFGITFQVPVVVFVLSLAGIVDPRTLGKYRPYVVVIGFIVGAILTPPDILSQTLLALPLLLLFEFGVLGSRIMLHFKGTPLKRERGGPAKSKGEKKTEGGGQPRSETTEPKQPPDAPASGS